MKPWQVSAGITVSVLGVTVILLGEELHYLPTHLLLEHWEPIALRAGLAVASLAAGLYAAARALGLTGLGRQTDLAERAIRRGHGDAELAQALPLKPSSQSGERQDTSSKRLQRSRAFHLGECLHRSEGEFLIGAEARFSESFRPSPAPMSPTATQEKKRNPVR